MEIGKITLGHRGHCVQIHAMSGSARDAQTAPRLSAGVRLQFDTRTGRHHLSHSGRVVLLNKMAIFVLRLCNGGNSRGDILQRMGTGPGTPLARDVCAFLDAARELRWISEDPRVSCVATARHETAASHLN